MHDIDFLPIECRRKHQRRQSQPWLIVTATAVVGLVAAAAIVQHWRWRYAEGQLAALKPAYETAVGLQDRLADVQQRLANAKAGAELYTYLRHPWPRTQLLAALLRPLPADITFLQVHIFRQPGTGRPRIDLQPPVDKKAEEDKLKALPAAGRDLAALRARLDPLQTVVVLGGTAIESEGLHRYLGVLDATDIFDKAELDCFNSVDNDHKGGPTLQFRAVLAVQPGYGQPGGPAGPPKNNVALNNQQK